MATRKGKLDESELFLLSRKQVMFADFVTWNYELVGRLEEAGILPGDDYPGIMSQPTNSERWGRFTTLLNKRGRHGDVDHLCDVLRLIRCVWVAEETAADLRAERGELQIDKDVDYVAGWVVHRQHGTGKRLAEGEKKLLQNIIAERTQVTLTAWKKQQESTEEDLRCTKQICDAKDKMAAELGNTMRQFVDSNKGRLRNAATLVWRQAVHAHLLNKDVRKSQLQIAEEEMNKLRNMTSHALLEMESLLDERRRALRLLNLDEESNSATWRLDEKIIESLKAAAQSIVDAKTSAASKDNEKEELEGLIRQLRETGENTLLGKDKEVLKYQDQVASANAEVEQQDMTVKRLRLRCKEAEEELDEWKERCEILERGKRLCYIYQRDGARTASDGDSSATASSGSLRPMGAIPKSQKAGTIRETPSGSVRPKTKKKSARKSAVAVSSKGRVTSEY